MSQSKAILESQTFVQLSEEQLIAGLTILECWRCYRTRQAFHALKEMISEAEHTLSKDVIRQLLPVESQLLQDPAIPAKIRFRLAGRTFPPDVVFKVFVPAGGQRSVQYFCGKDLIKPTSAAAEDALQQMGSRKFLDLMMEDAVAESITGMNSIRDAATPQDYIKYQSVIGELSADDGGKANPWRKISLQHLYRPVLRRSEAASAARARAMTVTGSNMPNRNMAAIIAGDTGTKQMARSEQHSKFREAKGAGKPRLLPSQLAKKRKLEKLRKLYGLAQKSSGDLIAHIGHEDEIVSESTEKLALAAARGDVKDDEVDELYTWSQQLCGDDLDMEF